MSRGKWYVLCIAVAFLAGAKVTVSSAQAVDKGLRYIGFSPHVSPGENADLRRAICWAIDREAAAKAVAPYLQPQEKFVAPALGLHHPQLPGYTGVEFYRFDPEKARQYLQKSEWSAALSFFVGRNPPPAHQAFYATVVQNVSRTLGLPVNLQAVDFQSLFRQFRAGNVAAYIHFWFAWPGDPGYPSFAMELAADRFLEADTKIKELYQGVDARAVEQYLLDTALICPVIWQDRVSQR